MTHKDIYIKFMIEYDKANVTSSYPSLTEYEVATVLDKAYNALIAQKITGNNPRRSTFESDIKSISDLNPLLKRKLLFLGASGTNTKSNNIFTKINGNKTEGFMYESYNFGDDANFQFHGAVRSMPDNMRSVAIPSDMLYFVAGALPVDMHTFAGWMNEEKFDSNNVVQPMDNKKQDYDNGEYKSIRLDPVKLVSHSVAEQFYATSYNIPWVKNPVCFLEGGRLYLLCDPIIGIPDLEYYDENSLQRMRGEWMSLTYIKKPNNFVKDLDKINKSIEDSSAGATVQYLINEDVYLNITIDRYNMSKINESSSFNEYNAQIGGNKIHINDIEFFYPYKLSERTSYPQYAWFPDTAMDQSNEQENTYYIECGISDYNARHITMKSILNRSLSIGSKTVKSANEDDSVSLSAGSKLIVTWATTSGVDESFEGQASKLFIIEYSDLYDILKTNGKISNSDDAWSSKVAYNPLTQVFSGKSQTDEIKVTSSDIYNSGNVTYTQGVIVKTVYPYEIYGDQNCTYRPSGNQNHIYLKFNTDLDPTQSQSIELGLTSTGKLSINISENKISSIVYDIDSDTWRFDISEENPYRDRISNQTVIELNSENTPQYTFDSDVFDFGTQGGIYVPSANTYLNSDYEYYDIFTKVPTNDEQPMSIGELTESLEFSYFKYECNDEDINIEDIENIVIDGKTIKDMYQFELDDVVAGELITLAVSYALENVESPRFNNHIQMRGLEA